MFAWLIYLSAFVFTRRIKQTDNVNQQVDRSEAGHLV